MKTPEIQVSQIYIGERYREDYGDIDQLCYSIKKNGLINPIAIGVTDILSEELREGNSLPFTLLAGGRRLRAVTKLGWEHAPVRIYSTPISRLDLRSIELAENFDRKDMEYPEEIALKREINNLQISLHGEKVARSADAPGWSQADTAKLLSQSAATVTKDIQLANAIKDHPELQLDKCKNKTEAFKRLKSVGKTIVTGLQAQAYTAQTSVSDDKLSKKLSSSYIIEDCFNVMAKLPSSSLNFIEIDPPYGIDLTNVKRDNTCEGYNEVPANDYKEFLLPLFKESYRLLREGSWLICWFGPDPWFKDVADWLALAGFQLNLLPGIWIKKTGQTMQPETYLGNAYEMFFYARKGKATLQKPGRLNTFHYPSVPPAQKYHPTQRPLDLMTDVYQTFCAPNSSGFIPCLGSGVGLLAGHASKINMIGTDLSDAFKDGYILNLKSFLETSND